MTDKDFVEALRKRALRIAEGMVRDLSQQPAAPHVVQERLRHAKRDAERISTIVDAAEAA